MEWAQDYALLNRSMMMKLVLDALAKHLPPFKTDGEAINCHHNYVAVEQHFGEKLFITRKGAISAREGQMGIIPGSMGARSYIVRGKGNTESFCSCSHGAGRRMSRTEAKRRFNRFDLAQQTEGVECRKDGGVVDEIPSAYKNIDEVMANQTDLVDIAHTLKQVICISHMVQDEIHERFAIARERLPVIYNAIDPGVFNPGLAVHRQEIRARYGIAQDACVFLIVGSEYARKGVGRAIEALAHVPPPAHLLVVGKDRHPSRYESLARTMHVANRVTFAGAQTDPRPFYGSADAFVLPTLYDALSNAVLEALASGLPVITSDRCGAGELVRAHDAGVVCGARDIEAIAAAMRAMLDATPREQASRHAIAAVADLTPAAMAARLVTLYETLLRS